MSVKRCKKHNEYPNLKLKEVRYGFGWVLGDDSSTQTIGNILDILDDEFKKLQSENKELHKALETKKLEKADKKDNFIVTSTGMGVKSLSLSTARRLWKMIRDRHKEGEE